MLRSHECCLRPDSLFPSIFPVRRVFRRMYLSPRNICPKYDVFRCLTISNKCRCVLARSNTSSLDMCFIQEIPRSLFNVHISKASVLEDLALSDQVSTPVLAICSISSYETQLLSQQVLIKSGKGSFSHCRA